MYQAEWLAVMRAQAGACWGEDAGDLALVEDFLRAIQGVDWTLAFRRLAGAVEDAQDYLALFDDRQRDQRLAAALAGAAAARTRRRRCARPTRR